MSKGEQRLGERFGWSVNVDAYGSPRALCAPFHCRRIP